MTEPPAARPHSSDSRSANATIWRPAAGADIGRRYFEESHESRQCAHTYTPDQLGAGARAGHVAARNHLGRLRPTAARARVAEARHATATPVPSDRWHLVREHAPDGGVPRRSRSVQRN